jgi:hypothetical protein
MLLQFPAVLLQYGDDSGPPLFLVVFLGTCAVAFAATFIVGSWKTFTKAGLPGWGALIPIYNVYLMTQVARKPGWWTLLMFIPLVNLVIHIILGVGIADSFGKSTAFGLGLVFLPFIFYPVLGLGEAVYRGDRW